MPTHIFFTKECFETGENWNRLLPRKVLSDPFLDLGTQKEKANAHIHAYHEVLEETES